MRKWRFKKTKIITALLLIGTITGIIMNTLGITDFLLKFIRPMYRQDLRCAITIVDGLTGHPIPPEELRVEIYNISICNSILSNFTPEWSAPYLIERAWYDQEDGRWKFIADAGEYIILIYDYEPPHRYYPCIAKIKVHETKHEDKITEVEPSVLYMYKRATATLNALIRVQKGINAGKIVNFINITADSEWWICIEMEIGVNEPASFLWLDRLYIDYVSHSGADDIILPDYAIWRGNCVKIMYDRERDKYYIDLGEKIETHEQYGEFLYIDIHFVKTMSSGTGHISIELVDYYECQSWFLRWWKTPQIIIQVVR